MKKLLLFPILLSLYACIDSQSVNINNENVFDYIQVTKGSFIYGDEFFQSATKKSLGKCLSNFSSCTSDQLALGDQIKAQIYNIHLTGNNMTVTDHTDKLLIAAAMVASQEGYKFITPMYSSWVDSYSEQPKSYTDCSAIYGSVFCITSSYKNAKHWEDYGITVIAYNDYEDIKKGVLYIDESLGNRVLPIFALYTEEGHETDSLHIYKNAWKTKYDVSDIIKGEQIEIKTFEIKNEQGKAHMSVAEKYKQ
ncbi:MAG: hypothetical protein IKZ49_04280 [Alphaproteobacteria bacterium]|nr:hypothetical protein [Alphaproteobacteria bacterium]